ncbi:MAG: CooT family nickel-binding protein [Candidatus Lokiarchaeota archaeon]|nr:CooT family nickel-binding protein [Candidatus Lokiarchaeota archaeon]
MCEFKIIKQNDGSQILEDIVVLTYTDNNELLFKDILGMGEYLESALIMSVNTLNQQCIVLEHPIIKDFMKLLKKINTNELTNSDIEEFSNELTKLKS